MPHDGRIGHVQQALRAGATVEQVAEATGIDPWFLDQVQAIEELAERLARASPRPPAPAGRGSRRAAKRPGFSDAQLGELRGLPEDQVRLLAARLRASARCIKTVDTCAAEFAARTPYHYSSYDEETEVEPRRARPR